MSRRSFSRGIAASGLAAAGALLLAGCAVTPVPIQSNDLRQIVHDDKRAASQGMVAVSGAITLPEAVARALKYNLEHRTRLWEQALAVGQLDASRFDMLPRMLADLGYFDRDKDPGILSPDAFGNPSSTRAPVTSDTTRNTADFGLSWSVLDFGLSYYGARQNADRVLIAAERRRKAVHTLIQNVRTTFWRAASAEKLARDVRETIDLAEKALADSRKLAASRGRAPADALRYQRTLLENLRTLETVERELAAARIELANLLNLAPGMAFKLAEPVGAMAKPGALALSLERMEEMALERNADLRENVYNVRIAATETRKALLKLFPNLGFSYTNKYDSNSFLVNQGWNEAAVRISWNVLNLLSGPSQIDVAETAVKVAESRRMTVQMAVLTQLHLAARQHDTSVQLYERSDAIWQVDDGLLEFARQGMAAETQSQQAMVASRTAAILSLVRRYQALAAVHEAASKLEATLGLEPQIGALDDISLPDLTRLIENSFNQWPGKAAGAAPEVAAITAAAAVLHPAEPGTQRPSAAPKTVAVTVSAAAAPAAQAVVAPATPAPALVQDKAAPADQPLRVPAEKETAAPAPAALPVAPPAAPANAPVQVKATPAVQQPPVSLENKSAAGWVVQLGAHRNPSYALDLARKARSLHLPAFFEEALASTPRRTLVRAGPFASREAAEVAAAKLAGIGLAGFVKPRQ